MVVVGGGDTLADFHADSGARVVEVVGSVASWGEGSSVGVFSGVAVVAGAVVAGSSVGAAEVGEPAAVSPSPQAVANINRTEPKTAAISQEGLVDMQSSLNLARYLSWIHRWFGGEMR